MGSDSIWSFASGCLGAFAPHEKFIHVTEHISSLFLFIESCSIGMHMPTLIIHSSANGHLGGVHILLL